MTLLTVARYAVLVALWRLEVPHVERGAWRIVETRALHVGVRPHTDGNGVAVTLQVSVRTPW